MMSELTSALLASLLLALSCLAQDGVWANKKSGWQLIRVAAGLPAAVPLSAVSRHR